MNFLLGMMVGGAILGGSGSSAPIASALASIPLRCLVAFTDGEDAYRACRRPSLAFEFTSQYRSTEERLSGLNHNNLGSSIDVALAQEIQGLKAIEAAMKQQQAR